MYDIKTKAQLGSSYTAHVFNSKNIYFQNYIDELRKLIASTQKKKKQNYNQYFLWPTSIFI